MPTYFGQDVHDATDVSNGSGILIWTPVTFTCPGSGNQNIQELSAWADLNAASSCAIRLGVYNTSDAKVAEGTSDISLTVGAAWQGHMSQSAVKAAGGSSPGVLTGGVEYKLALAVSTYSGGANAIGYNSGQSQIAPIKIGAFTGSDLPTSLPTPDGSDNPRYTIRCGVDPATAPPVTNLMAQICM